MFYSVSITRMKIIEFTIVLLTFPKAFISHLIYSSNPFHKELNVEINM